MRRSVLYLATTSMWSGCTCASSVTIAPPRVPEGGRAVALAVNLSNENNLIAATESGGLFRTFDGGKSFQHLDGFPTYAPVDVSFASLDENVVIATARDDFRTPSGGGIWRSTDGGASWTRPQGWPPADTTCARPSAWGISHMPLSRTFYVATDCGLAVSTDNGASFSTTVLDSSSRAIRAVLVINRTTGVAADDRRVWHLQGGTWTPDTAGPAGSTVAIHALASPWWANGSIFYFIGGDRELYFSTDAGASWTQAAAPHDDPNRELFVRVGRGLDGDPTHVDLYLGTGKNFFRQAVTVAVPGGSADAWRPLNVDHSDPADVAFSPGYERPIMLATDGGVHVTPDSGKNWKLTGSGYGGYNALQIGEITGRAVSGTPSHLELYYATQDNAFHASLDAGQTWTPSLGSEGAYVSADAANPSHLASPVTLRNCDSRCTYLLVQPRFDSSSVFPSAPNGAPNDSAGAPFEIVGDAYLQGVTSSGTAVASSYFLTTTQGAGWSASFSIPFEPQGSVRFSGSLANPVAYTGVKRPGSIIGLFRAQNIATQAVARRADSTGLGSLGLLHTAQARYAVFGVDPANPDHLIAADASDSLMKASADGGITWFPVPRLTTAVTDSGRFLGVKAGASFATTIAWDPTNSCHILVGTMQNGVIRSADGGLSWSRVPGSEAVTYVTSFFFPPTGSVWASAYGRSLWTLSVDRRPPKSGRCGFPSPTRPFPIQDTALVWPMAERAARPFGGLRDTIVCSTCSLIAVHNGTIVNLKTTGAQLTGMAIGSGVVDERDRSGRELPLSVPDSYSSRGDGQVERLVTGDLLATRRLRGLIVRGNQLVALLLSRDELPLPAFRAPLLYVAGSGHSGLRSVATYGDTIVVRGYGFRPGSGPGGVAVIVGADTVARGSTVAADGSFSVRVLVSRAPGVLQISALQRDGNRVTIERAEVDVVARDP
jgi:photosystem II stability/assembly factor-like uncharacterized protein